MNINTKPNWALLAGLRFLLALVVLCVHMNTYWPNAFFKFGSGFNAQAAVVAFLIVSGFSIGHSLQRKREGFLQRRFWRIYPIYFLCTLYAVGLVLAGPSLGVVGDESTPFQMLSHFAFGQSLWVHAMPKHLPSWSLAVEVVFYLAAPFIMLLRPHFRISILLASMALYCWNPLQRQYYELFGPVVPLSLLWAFMLGFNLALVPDRVNQALLLIVPVVAAFGHFGPSDLAFLTVLFSALLLINSHRVRLPEKWNTPILTLGDLSYPLYLAHNLAIWTVLYLRLSNPAAVLALSFVMSCLLLRIEQPLRAWMQAIPKVLKRTETEEAAAYSAL